MKKNDHQLRKRVKLAYALVAIGAVISYFKFPETTPLWLKLSSICGSIVIALFIIRFVIRRMRESEDE